MEKNLEKYGYNGASLDCSPHLFSGCKRFKAKDDFNKSLRNQNLEEEAVDMEEFKSFFETLKYLPVLA